MDDMKMVDREIIDMEIDGREVNDLMLNVSDKEGLKLISTFQ